MRITVVRTGGFTGVTRTYTVDPADLSPSDAQVLLSLAHKLRSRHRRWPRASQPGTSDAFQYDLEIDDEGTVLKFPHVESTSPSAALELARSVIGHAHR